MFRALVLYYIIGLISCNVRCNSTVADSEINGPIVSFSEVITNSDNAVSEAELATASTQNAGVFDLDSISTEEPSLNARHCPRASSKPCVVKCCPLGESLGFSRLCEPSSLKFEVIFFGGNQTFTSTTDDDFDYIIGDPCEFQRYRLEPRYDSTDEFHVLRNGTLLLPFQIPNTVEPDGYCLEVFLDPDEEEEVLPLICFEESPNQPNQTGLQFIIYPIGLLISVPFLIITLLVYCRIPKLRNLQGKSLICHVACLIVAYIFLAAVQLGGEELDSRLCVAVAFVIQFSFLGCFFWLNVLSINMWLNVRANIRLQRVPKKSSQNSWGYIISTNNEAHVPKKNERKFFIWYSVYAWCFPAAIVVVSMVFDLMPVIPSSYLKPNFGDNKCWFSSQDAELPYFYGPVVVIICITIVLLAFTAHRVYCHHWRTARPKLRQILRMNFCLFCLTSFNWLMEVVSWLIGGPDYIWYITDFVNSVQGLTIFAIFVLEPEVRSCVWEKWGPELSHISQVKCCSRNPNDGAVYSSPEDAIRNNT